MAAPHWAWGVGMGAFAGWALGDSKTDIAIGSLAGSPWGATAASYTGRGLWTATVWAAGTAPGLALRGAAWSATGYAASAATAAIAPLAAGYAVSYAIAGDQGTKDYMDYLHSFNPYTDRGISVSDWYSAVTLRSMR